MKNDTPTVEAKIAKWFNMSESTWLRHANPWSVYTRIPVIPIMALAIWSRAWIGWYSLIPIVLSILWTWYNPRVFPPVKTTDNWASRGVFGERVWLNRKKLPVPEHHRVMPNILSGIQAFGVIFLGWGLWKLVFWPTLVGIIIMLGAKIWFVDRMVCIYEDMKHIPDYGKWEMKSK